MEKSIGNFIAQKRKERGLTQKELAGRLNISFQAVSKWEQNMALPGTDILLRLAGELQVNVEDILKGEEQDRVSYSRAGVDISYTDAIKDEMEKYVSVGDERILNKMGAFASLYDFHFEEIRHPVLVLKAEEPGSKQKLALEYGYTESICHDMINHLVNDIMVMNARPLAVLDTIVCGKAEKDTIKSLVKGISEACRENECVLAGGETSIQPNVVEKGVYVLTASIAGVAEKEKIIDGRRIEEGDRILAVASNGLHTNGYSLVRLLMDMHPDLPGRIVEEKNSAGETFIEAVMRPHTAYYPIMKNILDDRRISGIAHITGGGIRGNLKRIIPEECSAEIDLSLLKIQPLFRIIKEIGKIPDEEMLSTFNCGAGLILVVKEKHAWRIGEEVGKRIPCYEIGRIAKASSKEKVVFRNRIRWESI